MFDIGFWELVVCAVVALIVFGPEEFPAMVRNVMATLSKARRLIGNLRADLEHEINKADEIKQLVAREMEIARIHEAMNAEQLTISTKGQPAAAETAPSHEPNAAAGAPEEVAQPHPTGPSHGAK